MIDIYIDMDETIAGFERHRMERMKEVMPSCVLPLDQVTDFYGRKSYARVFGEKVAEVCENLTIEPGFFLNLPVIDGAQKAIAALRRKYNVCILSSPMSRHPFCEQEKRAWLAKHFDQELADTAIITKDKHLFDGRYLIDDRPNLMTYVPGVTPPWNHILFRTPANYNSVGQVSVLEDWHHISDLFELK